MILWSTVICPATFWHDPNGSSISDVLVKVLTENWLYMHQIEPAESNPMEYIRISSTNKFPPELHLSSIQSSSYKNIHSSNIRENLARTNSAFGCGISSTGSADEHWLTDWLNDWLIDLGSNSIELKGKFVYHYSKEAIADKSNCRPIRVLPTL